MLSTIRRLLHRFSKQVAARQRFLTAPAPRNFERLEARTMLAADTFGAIAGIAFNDLSADGLTTDDGFVAQATVNLYRDVNLNGQLDAADAALGSTTTSVSDGSYRFDDLGAGAYLVEQVGVSGYLQRAGENVQAVTITADDALGQMGTPIDSFVTMQAVSASSAASGSRAASSTAAAVEAIGGERDIEVELTSPFGEVELNVNPFGQPLLEIASSSNAFGRRVVTWDGPDGVGDSLAPEGLNHFDLTEGGDVTGFVINIGADHPDGIATFRVYTDAANWSERMIPIPEQLESVTVFFREFSTGAGDGASFTDAGAIQLEITANAAVDGQIDVITTIGPTVLEANFANYEPVSVGNQVWSDANNNGVFESGTEEVLAGVTLNLYADTDGDQKLTPGTDQFLASTATDSGGRYLFDNLFPGSYVVQVAQANFDAGGVLENFVTSSGNAPTLDPDNGNLDHDDNGDAVAGHGVAACAVTLAAHGEPINDGDNDANSNLTVDFGFEELIPDVAISKTDNLSTIVPGQQLDYRITVSSVGNTVAEQVVVEDVLPVDLVTLVSTSDGANVVYDADSGRLRWSAGDIASGDSRTLLVAVTAVNPAPAAAETVTNTVTVTHADPDPTPDDNTATDVDDLAASPDYTITKDDGLSSVAPGATVNYAIVVSNVGNQDGTGVVVTDQYPVDVLSVVSTVPLTTVDAATGTIVWDLGNLDAGDSRVITLQAQVLPGVDPSITEFTNSVRVTDDLANGADPTPGNNVAADTDQIIYTPDVSITKTDHLTTITAGQQLTYEITVNSIGTATAENVTVEDLLPPDLVLLNSTSDAANVDFDADTGRLVWSAGDIARGGSKTLRVTVTVVDSVPAGRDSVVNPVTVTHDGDDPTPENNSASDVDILAAAPDYRISKSDRLTNVIPGQLITYQIQVTNVGNQDGTGVQVTDTFPTESLVGVSAGPGGAIDQASGTVVWELGDLAVGQSRNVTFQARVASSIDLAIEEFTNVARVADDGANGPDPTPENNVASDTDLVDLVLSEVSGVVYVDFNDNGLMDPSELAIAGVPIRLFGTDVRGNTVDLSTQTGPDGRYLFEDLAPGLYDIVETQPDNFNDGQDTAGAVRSKDGGLLPQTDLQTLQVLDDQFAQLGLGAGVEAYEFNFGELMVMRSKRDHLGWRF